MLSFSILAWQSSVFTVLKNIDNTVVSAGPSRTLDEEFSSLHLCTNVTGRPQVPPVLPYFPNPLCSRNATIRPGHLSVDGHPHPIPPPPLKLPETPNLSQGRWSLAALQLNLWSQCCQPCQLLRQPEKFATSFEAFN